MPAMQRALTVLLVDDEADVCALVRHYLAKSVPHASVITASNGEEGLRRFRALQPDLVISNNHMPCMDGPEMISILRASGVATPIISISNAEGAEERALGAGASAFLDKEHLSRIPELVERFAPRSG